MRAHSRNGFSWNLRELAPLCFMLGIALLSACGTNPPVEVVMPTAKSASAPTQTLAPSLPQSPRMAESPLKDSIIAAGDYLKRQQLPNGELSYQVDFFRGERAYSPVHLRLLGGTGALYTVCRVSEDNIYCEAGDLALNHYLRLLVVDEAKFKGACFYAEGYCSLGGAALAVDVIYKRWQATGSAQMGGKNLLNTATELGYFIVSMRKADGGFYYAYDPVSGMVNPNYFMSHFPGESLLALLELYEMTANNFWLQQAREVSAYMVKQPVSEDHWHAYALSKMAQVDALSPADLAYAEKIAEAMILGGVRSLNPKNSSISSANKIEGLSALAQAFQNSGRRHEQLDAEIPLYVTFVHARQLPANDCGWEISSQVAQTFGGGIFSTCEESTIRVDAQQSWINGVTAYLEYLGGKQSP